MTVFTDIKKEDLNKLNGFVKDQPKTVYEELRLNKEGVTLILYISGKLLLQGQPEKVKALTAQLEKLRLGTIIKTPQFRKETGWIIGTDESLKGDTFGGLVVAAVKADDQIRQQLISLGVADSKTLADKEILYLAEKIKKIAPCEIKSLLPEEYNRSGKVTELLNKLHADCANYLFPGKHVVDKYPGCTVGDVQEEKAESKYVEVAAASILARAAGLDQFNYLSRLAGFTLPLGSTHVKEALAELKRRELDFKQFVKIDFSNVREFLKI